MLSAMPICRCLRRYDIMAESRDAMLALFTYATPRYLRYASSRLMPPCRRSPRCRAMPRAPTRFEATRMRAADMLRVAQERGV